MKGYVTSMRKALSEVFSHFSYLALSSILAILALVSVIWFPNLRLITSVFGNYSIPFLTKIKIIGSLLFGIGTNFSIFSAGYTVIIACLFGINITMIIYFFKRRRGNLKGRDLVPGLSGTVSGTFGIGCVACGSFILTTILSSFGATSVLALLPLGGGEFGILGIILFVVSIAFISRQIVKPMLCKI